MPPFQDKFGGAIYPPKAVRFFARDVEHWIQRFIVGEILTSLQLIHGQRETALAAQDSAWLEGLGLLEQLTRERLAIFDPDGSIAQWHRLVQLGEIDPYEAIERQFGTGRYTPPDAGTSA